MVLFRSIAKYASKAESKFEALQGAINIAISKCTGANERCSKLIRKILMSSVADRDYCAQEVVHFLMGYGFYHSSREFVVVNIKQLEWMEVKPHKGNKGIFHKYCQRPHELQEVSVYEYAKFYKVRGSHTSKRNKCAIVRLFPKPVFTNLEDISEVALNNMYCFFVPWRNLCDLNVCLQLKLEKILSIKDELARSLGEDLRFEDVEPEDKCSAEECKEAEFISAHKPKKSKMKVQLGKRDVDVTFKVAM